MNLNNYRQRGRLRRSFGIFSVLAATTTLAGIVAPTAAHAFPEDVNDCYDDTMQYYFSDVDDTWTNTEKGYVEDAFDQFNLPMDLDGYQLIDLSKMPDEWGVGIEVTIRDVPGSVRGSSECNVGASIWINRNPPSFHADSQHFYHTALHEMFHLGGAEHTAWYDNDVQIYNNSNDPWAPQAPPQMATCGSSALIEHVDTPTLTPDDLAYMHWLHNDASDRQLAGDPGFENSAPYAGAGIYYPLLGETEPPWYDVDVVSGSASLGSKYAEVHQGTRYGEIEHRSTSTANSGASTVSSLTISKPAGTWEYDVLLATISTRKATPTSTVTPPTGWTLAVGSTGSGGHGVYTYYKVATNSEPSNYTFNLSASAKAVGSISAYVNVDYSNPIDSTSSGTTASTTAQVAPAATASFRQRMVYNAWAVSGVVSFTPSSNTERSDLATASGTGVSLSTGDRLLASAGSSGTSTTTSSVAEAGRHLTVVLNPGGGYVYNTEQNFVIMTGDDLEREFYGTADLRAGDDADSSGFLMLWVVAQPIFFGGTPQCDDPNYPDQLDQFDPNDPNHTYGVPVLEAIEQDSSWSVPTEWTTVETDHFELDDPLYYVDADGFRINNSIMLNYYNATLDDTASFDLDNFMVVGS